MTVGPLGLAPVEFWTDPTRTRDEVIQRVLTEDFTGLLLDGPEVVSLAIRDSLPLVGIRALPLDEDARTSFLQEAVLVAVRLETNRVLATTAYPWKQPIPVPPPDENELAARNAEGPRPEGTVAGLFVVDARSRLPELPWQEGTVLATVLLGTRASNRVRVRLELPPRAVEHHAATLFVESHRSAGYPKPVWPPVQEGRAFPQYPAPAPEDPTEPGIVLWIVRPVVPLTEGEPWVLRGTFALRVMGREIVRARDSDDLFARLGGAGWQDVGDSTATAVIPITLVLTGSEVLGPYVVTLQVPVVEPMVAGEDGKLVRGRFAVDLLALEGFAFQPQTYVVWAFSGEVMAGPWTVTLLPPVALAPR